MTTIKLYIYEGAIFPHISKQKTERNLNIVCMPPPPNTYWCVFYVKKWSTVADKVGSASV